MSPPPPASTPTAEDNTMENYESNTQQTVAGPSSTNDTSSSTPIMCPPHHPAMGVMGFLDTRHVDFNQIHQMSRQRYPDGTTVNMNTGSVNIQGINFNSM